MSASSALAPGRRTASLGTRRDRRPAETSKAPGGPGTVAGRRGRPRALQRPGRPPRLSPWQARECRPRKPRERLGRARHDPHRGDPPADGAPGAAADRGRDADCGRGRAPRGDVHAPRAKDGRAEGAVRPGGRGPEPRPRAAGKAVVKRRDISSKGDDKTWTTAWNFARPT